MAYVDGQHLGAFAEQSRGGGPADAGIGAGDDRCLVGESHGPAVPEVTRWVANTCAGRPGVTAGRCRTDPGCGQRCTCEGVRPNDAEVMYIVRRSAPPKAMLVGRRTGTGSCSRTEPSGAKRTIWAPSQNAHQMSPAASTRRPSGMPFSAAVSTKISRSRASPSVGVERVPVDHGPGGSRRSTSSDRPVTSRCRWSSRSPRPSSGTSRRGSRRYSRPSGPLSLSSSEPVQNRPAGIDGAVVEPAGLAVVFRVAEQLPRAGLEIRRGASRSADRPPECSGPRSGRGIPPVRPDV